MPRSLVVKLGTNVLADTSGRLDRAFFAEIARQIAALLEAGTPVTLVSSGAVQAGVAELRLERRPEDLAQLQAVAAVGQRVLMDAWADAFTPLGRPVGQVLLTRQDVDDRVRFLNLRNTVAALHELGAVPVVNENDTVATDELTAPAGATLVEGSAATTFGDNDLLAAVVTAALPADRLLLLSTVPGLLDAEGQVVPEVTDVAAVQSYVRAGTSSGGTGGMGSKLEAARLVTAAGETLVLAHGREPDVVLRVARGEAVGTAFRPSHASRLHGRARWIASTRPAGRIRLDSGATRAVVGGAASLLPAGITHVDGDFERGDVVDLLDPSGRAVARGLSNYPAVDVARIAGRRTAEVAELLPGAHYDEVVHRDHLVILIRNGG